MRAARENSAAPEGESLDARPNTAAEPDDGAGPVAADPDGAGSEDTATPPEQTSPEHSWPRRAAARYITGLSTSGIAFGVLFAWASLTPSLIPRVWIVQGAFTGLALISGYGVGIVIGWVLELIGLTELVTPLVRRIMRWTIGFLTIVGTVIMLIVGSGWQNEVRALLDMPDGARWPFIGVPIIALVLALIILQIARSLRWLSLKITGLISRILPPRFSRLIAVLLVGWFAWSIFSGVLWNAMLDGLDRTFAVVNDSYDKGVLPPEGVERSGSPDSSVTWESLGLQGRRFVTGGPTVEQIEMFHDARPEVEADAEPQDDGETREPIRAYAGLDGRSDFNAIAADVVRELDRTDAWDRDVLVVATTTGTGWVDSSMSDALELMHDGDTAIAAMQYSNLPSWLSFVGDQTTPPAAGKALFEAVYAAWDEQPEESRPKLIVFGISLGSFGTQGAFSGVQDMESRTDGALLVGTPGFTSTWRDVTNRRDPGSFEHAPVYQEGRSLRFMTGPPGSSGDPMQLPGEWEEPRIVYAQHASDGVTWWSPDLLITKPDWLDEERGRDVHPQMTWYPIVTFWQLTSDLFFAADEAVPMGRGHHFKLEYSDALAMIVPPQGWADADTALLRTAIAGRADVEEPELEPTPVEAPE